MHFRQDINHIMNPKSDYVVAKKIVDELIKNNFLPENKKEEWIKKISLGQATYQDWYFLSELYFKKNGEE